VKQASEPGDEVVAREDDTRRGPMPVEEAVSGIKTSYQSLEMKGREKKQSR